MRKRTFLALSLAAALAGAAMQTPQVPVQAQQKALAKLWLSDLDIKRVEQSWGVPGRDVSVSGKALRIGGVSFEKGFGTHADSEVHLQVNGAQSFSAQVGVDDEANQTASLVFSVRGDGKTLWTSGVMKRGQAPKNVQINLKEVQVLSLLLTDGGDGNQNDHGNWGAAQFEVQGKMPVIVARLPEQRGKILPGRVWEDTTGRLIQAHGGGILKRGKNYYWYGEEKSQGYNNKVGVAAYVSRDLTNWKPLGVVLPAGAMPEQFRDKGVCERPKVIYNARTKKYVLWAHMDARGYAVSEAGVAIADRPEGPFRWVQSFRPVPSSTYRDMNVFVDDDARAYAFYSGEENQTMHVVRLNADYTDIERPLVEGQNWSRILIKQAREAPAPFKYRGKYYVFTSGCTGWDPNPAGYATADSIFGPWTSHNNPCTSPGANTTYRSQSTFVLPIEGKPGHFLYMGDRWNSKDLANSRYVWLPFQIKADGTFELPWRDSWDARALLKQ